MLKRYKAGVAFACAAIGGVCCPAQSQVIYQSAIAGPLANTGLFVDNSQILGVRFTTTQAYRVTNIRFNVSGNGTLFAAINPLNAATPFPANRNLSDAVFATTFTPAGGVSSVLAIPAHAVLFPGTYSLLIGSGLFGATGNGLAPSNATDIGTPRYFYSNLNGFIDGGFSSALFEVEGVPTVPEPGSVALLTGIAVTGAALLARRKRGNS